MIIYKLDKTRTRVRLEKNLFSFKRPRTSHARVFIMILYLYIILLCYTGTAIIIGSDVDGDIVFYLIKKYKNSARDRYLEIF